MVGSALRYAIISTHVKTYLAMPNINQPGESNMSQLIEKDRTEYLYTVVTLRFFLYLQSSRNYDNPLQRSQSYSNNQILISM